jgi:hypothetical protein
MHPDALISSMALDEPLTAQKLEGPKVKQFSIFLENKVGALLDVVKLINERGVDVLALSVTDSSDTAITRILVSDPETVERLFREQAIPYSLAEMVVVELKGGAAEIGKLLTALLMAEVNMHFSYPLLTRPRGRPAIAMHLEDFECAANVLRGQGFRLLSQSDISR